MDCILDKNGKRFDISNKNSEENQRYLAYLHKRKEPLYCHCNKLFKARKLSICKRQGNYYIKRYPTDGMLHDVHCRFYSSTEGTGEEAEKAFKVDDDGNINVKLNISFFDKPKKSSNSTTSSSYGSDTVTKNKTSPLGFLQSLWAEYNLDTYNSHKERNYYVIKEELETGIRKSRLDGSPTSKGFVYVADPYPGEIVSVQDIAKQSHIKYPLIIGLLKQLNDQEGERPSIKLYGIPKIFCDDKQMKGYKKSCNQRASWSSNNKNDGYDLVILQVEIKEIKGGMIFNLRGNTMQSIALTKDFISCESSYERAFAHELVRHKRSFIKPMGIDNALGMIPDFVLTDMREEYYIEIWGYNTEQYLERKQLKQHIYKENNLRLIEWHAADGDVMPQLPKKG